MRMCVRCERTTPMPVTVRTIRANTGPGWSVYACPECAPHYLNAEEAWHQYLKHVSDCRGCTDGTCSTGSILTRVYKSVLARECGA